MEDVEGDLDPHKADYAQHGVTMGRETTFMSSQNWVAFELLL